MSYCRWSSDFGRCDLYVYESVCGFESHVAGRRLNVEPPQHLLLMPTGTSDEWLSVMRAEWEWRDSLEVDREIPDELWFDLHSIGPEAGTSFVDSTPGECAKRLRALRDKGFNVPQYAIDALEEEANE